jgi:hypothetical protein
MYLDSGTNNETYLRDPLYVGLRQRRPTTEELYAFVDEFVDAVQEVFPNCCIHFEDWTGTDAIALLESNILEVEVQTAAGGVVTDYLLYAQFTDRALAADRHQLGPRRRRPGAPP